MPAAAKDRAMLAFQAGRTQLLIATTVIEVGVDVPNATLMVIDNAERMGLAQLHQLRSEEHTSELQSQSNLVCRLLLEKKKPTPQPTATSCSPRPTRPAPPRHC